MLGASLTAKKMGASELTIDQQISFIGPPLVDSFIRECNFSDKDARKAVELYRQRYKERGLYEAKHYDQITELLILINENNCNTVLLPLKGMISLRKLCSTLDYPLTFIQ